MISRRGGETYVGRPCLQTGSSEASNAAAKCGKQSVALWEIDMNATVFPTPSNHAQETYRRLREEYAIHSAFSTPGRHAALFDTLPSDAAGVARTVQGSLIYEHVAEPFYGYPLPVTRRAESHIRRVEQILDTLLALDNRPLSEPRPPEKRLVGICHHFMLLAIAIFRHHSVPARGRGGF
jgi:hypothetical protein